MSNLASLLAMSGLLGLGSFGVAQLPLSIVLSDSAINYLSNFGTGLLLGAALGVVLPEGIEAMIDKGNPSVSTTWIAVSLIMGFSFMLLVEQLTGSDHSHSYSVDYDAFDLRSISESSRSEGLDRGLQSYNTGGSKKAIKLTLGLVVHSLADGFALGASAFSAESTARSSPSHSELPLVIFFALLMHKAPAALALTTSLLVTPLSRSAVRKHLAVFAASTPMGAIATYFLLSLLNTRSGSGWIGQVLLFSAGTFLYVATVLQPIFSHDVPSSQASRKLRNMLLIICGMFLPLGISLLIEHDHGALPGDEIPGGIRVSSR